MTKPLPRRAFLAALACAAALAAPHPSGAGTLAPAGTTAISRIVVDTAPLRAKGLGGPFVATIEASLQSALRRSFADRLGGGRGGATLVVRIDGVQTASYVGSGGGRFDGGSLDSDYMEGVATLVGPRGEVLASAPQLSALPASSGGSWYLPDNLLRRTAALSNQFAGWLRSTLAV